MLANKSHIVSDCDEGSFAATSSGGASVFGEALDRQLQICSRFRLPVHSIALGLFLLTALLLFNGTAHAQSPDGVQDQDFPTGFWAIDYYEGQDGSPADTRGQGPTNGGGGPGTAEWRGESFAGVGANGAINLQSNGSAANNRWARDETPTSPLLPPGYAGTAWTSSGNPFYQIEFRRTASSDAALRIGFNSDALYDDALLVEVNGVRVFNNHPFGTPDDGRILGTDFRSSPPHGFQVRLNAGDEILVVFQNFGAIGGYDLNFEEAPAPSLSKAVDNFFDSDGSGDLSLGDQVNYTITATNNSPISSQSYTISDPILTPNSITCPNVASGGTCVLSGSYIVQSGDVSAGAVNNLATLTSPNFPFPVEATQSIAIGTTTSTTADLSITKTNTPGVNNEIDQANDGVTSGGTTTYTVIVTNNGPDEVSGAIVTDTPGAGITCPASNPVTITGAGVPAGTFTISDLTGSGIALGTLSDGQNTTITYTCGVN